MEEIKEELLEQVKIITAENDLFGTYGKARAISNFIKLEANGLLKQNNLIAIYGEWGSGKSCLMKTIANKLEKDGYKTLNFDTWKYEKDENLTYSLFKFIIKDNTITKIKELGKQFIENAYGIFKSATKGIEINIPLDINNPNNNIVIKPNDMLDEAEKKNDQIIQKIEDEKCLWEKIDAFEQDFKKISFHGKKLIVFLDDLDRCESENIITLISSIKLLLSANENIIFIIGIDKKGVTLALQNKYKNDYNKAEEYLEKIFPISFSLTNRTYSNKAIKYFKDVIGIDMEECQQISYFFDYIDLTNARKIKKVLRKYLIIKKYIEVNAGIVETKSLGMIILILYIIILNFFYNDEYEDLFENLYSEKIDNNYNPIILHNPENSKSYKFNEIKNKTCYKLLENKTYTYDFLPFLLRFSSKNIKRNELEINNSNNFSYENWKFLFDENICNKFVDFIIKRDNLIKDFINEKNNKIDVKKILRCLIMLDEIL